MEERSRGRLTFRACRRFCRRCRRCVSSNRSTRGCPPTTTIAATTTTSKCDRGAYEVVGYINSNALDIVPGQCGNSTLTINEKFAIGRLLAGVNLLTYNRQSHELDIRLFSPGLPG